MHIALERKNYLLIFPGRSLFRRFSVIFASTGAENSDAGSKCSHNFFIDQSNIKIVHKWYRQRPLLGSTAADLLVLPRLSMFRENFFPLHLTHFDWWVWMGPNVVLQWRQSDWILGIGSDLRTWIYPSSGSDTAWAAVRFFPTVLGSTFFYSPKFGSDKIPASLAWLYRYIHPELGSWTVFCYLLLFIPSSVQAWFVISFPSDLEVRLFRINHILSCRWSSVWFSKFCFL